MMIVHSYPIAVALCMLTMVCWGSWANTLKMEPSSYGFSLLLILTEEPWGFIFETCS